MKKPLLATLSHSAVNDTVARHWPYWKASGCDILGVGRSDKPVTWPASVGTDGLVDIINVGCEADKMPGPKHINRLLAALQWFEAFGQKYSDVIVTEYDGVTFRPPPEIASVDVPVIETLLAGGHSQGFYAPEFYHAPWRFNHLAARLVIDAGNRMKLCGLIEQGMIDRWLGLMICLNNWSPLRANAYSRNTIEMSDVPVIRERIRQGTCWHAHGVKSREVLEAIVAT